MCCVSLCNVYCVNKPDTSMTCCVQKRHVFFFFFKSAAVYLEQRVKHWPTKEECQLERERKREGMKDSVREETLKERVSMKERNRQIKQRWRTRKTPKDWQRMCERARERVSEAETVRERERERGGSSHMFTPRRRKRRGGKLSLVYVSGNASLPPCSTTTHMTAATLFCNSSHEDRVVLQWPAGRGERHRHTLRERGGRNHQPALITLNKY